MDYFEYLNKNIEQQKINRQVQETDAPQDTEIKVFGEEFEVQQNSDGASIFNFATSEQLNELDFDKIVLEKDNAENPPVKDDAEVENKENALEYVLRDILSFEEVKKEADIDGDGIITADEAKEFFMKLAEKDGESGSLTTEDFDIFLKEKGIDLEEIYKKNLENNPENTAVTNDESVEQASSPTEGTVESAPTEQATQPAESSVTAPTEQATQPVESSVAAPTEQVTQPAQQYNISAPVGNSSLNYSNNNYLSSNYESKPVEKTINNMTLDELQAEKTKRETTLSEKQSAVNDVHNGTNEKVKSAKTKADNAKNLMQDAILKDNQVNIAHKQEMQTVLENIDKNDSALEENSVQLNDNEVAIEKTNTTIENLTNSIENTNTNITNLNGSISDLNAQISSIGDTDDKKLISKKSSLNKRLENQKTKLAECKTKLEEDQASLKEAESSKQQLEQDKDNLETTKADLTENKETYNKQLEEVKEKIKQECSPQTKAKIQAYETAIKNVETVRAKELKTAQEAQTEALNAVKEVDVKISEVQSRKIKASNTSLDIEDIPLSVRNRCSGGKIQTLPDGTEVLTLGYTRLDQMQPEMIEKIGELQQLAAEEGLTFVVSDGSRTVSESDSSRARKGNIVAKGGSSPHNYGVAIDIALYKDGKDVSADVVRDFAQKAKAETGIAWGGDFKSNGSQETHHYELANWRSQYKTQDNLITRHESIT